MGEETRDTTVKKVQSSESPAGSMGELQLASGKRVSMRLWRKQPGEHKASSTREYETVGYVVKGRAELELEGQVVHLEAGDSWLVPAGARHHYTVLEPLEAIEATSPPAQVHGRSEG